MEYTYMALCRDTSYFLQLTLAPPKLLFWSACLMQWDRRISQSWGKVSRLVGSRGTIFNELGKAVVLLQLGPVQLEAKAIAAEIDDDGLLGIDVLQNENEGPTDLLMSKGVLIIENQKISLIQVYGGLGCCPF